MTPRLARGRNVPAGCAVALAGVALVRVFVMADQVSQPNIWIPRLEHQAWAPLEALVRASLLAAGAILTCTLSARVSGLPWHALVLSCLALWWFPGEASAAAFLLYAVTLLVCERYVREHRDDRIWWLTALTVLIAALRPDHAIYVFAACMGAVFAQQQDKAPGAFRAAALQYVGLLAIVALLFLPLPRVDDRVGAVSARVLSALAAPLVSPEPFRRPEVGPVHFDRTFNIRWKPEIDLPRRLAKEGEYALVGGQLDPDDQTGRTWRYGWDDPPAERVLRLVEDPAVEDTHRIDRATGLYVEEWTPGRRLMQWAAGTARTVLDSAIAALPWLWVLLPVAAVVRLRPRAPGDNAPRLEAGVVPALALCVPVGWMATRGITDAAAAAAPALPALIVVAAWVLAQGSPRPPEDAVLTRDPARSAGGPLRTASVPRADVAILGALSIFTVFLHLYVNTDVTNDHAGYLSMARQTLYGDWPIRDFRDDGSLLQILLSAAVQKVGGFHLLGEMALSWAFFAAANGLTYWLAFRLSGSRIAAVIATCLAALLIPRPYGYPKVFIYPLAILALWRYVERPAVSRLAAVAGAAALALLFRIDHGVVVGAAGLLAVVLAHARNPQLLVRDVIRLGGFVVLFALPQLTYITWAVGPIRYAQSILTFGAYADAMRESWPWVFSSGTGWLTESNAVVVVLYVFLAVAVTAAVYAGVSVVRAWRSRSAPSPQVLRILLVVIVWALMLPMLARGQYYTRVAEIGQPIAVLGAWLAVTWLASGRSMALRWAVLTPLLALTVLALCWRTPAARFFTRSADVFRGAPFQAEELKRLATSPPIKAFAPLGVEGEHWIAGYVDRCTRTDDRVLLTGFGPEIFFYTGRAFAGDRWVYMPFDNSTARQRAVVDRLKAQSVPLVLVDPELYAQFSAAWPLLAEHIERSYETSASVSHGHRTTRVLVARDRSPSHRIEFATLPCFAAAS